MNRIISPLLVVSLGTLLSGCCGLVQWPKNTQSSSVVQFLYPSQQPIVQPSIPRLNLPLRVGIAFVPPGKDGHGELHLSEAEKARVLRKVSADFKQLPYVSSIEVIPATYLRSGGGFDNLDQLRSMLGIDVIALLAYDQMQVSSDTAYSLSYWTIVGAYVIPAQKNDTATLMETVVYDISSRRLLFRASGTGVVNHHSTLVGMGKSLLADSQESFTLAADEMTANLKVELDAFKERIKETPDEVQVSYKPGYGGGAFSGWGAASMALCAVLVMRFRATRRHG